MKNNLKNIKNNKMEITLKNFKIHEDVTYSFEGGKLTLISGPSGAGKTSIMDAIQFVLFGKGTKLPTQGKRKCMVEMKLENLIVTRTKCPNRLVVKVKDTKKTYTDDAAQSIIDSKFGTTFTATSYVTQDTKGAFISMSPMEKLGFLEKFAFGDINLVDKKKRVKKLIVERKEKLKIASGKLEVASGILDEIKEPELVSFPFPCKKKKNQEKMEKNERSHISNCVKKIKKHSDTINSSMKQLSSAMVQTEKLSVLKESVFNGENSILKMKSSIETLDFQGKEYLENLEKQRCYIEWEKEKKTKEEKRLSDLELKKEKDKILEMKRQRIIEIKKKKQEERDMLNLKLEELEESEKQEEKEVREKLKKDKDDLWDEYDRKEIDSLVEDTKELIDDLSFIDRQKSILSKKKDSYLKADKGLENVKEELEETIQNVKNKERLIEKINLEKQVYTCPCCDESLRFVSNKLQEYKERVETDFDLTKLKNEVKYLKKSKKTLLSKIKKFERTISEYDSILKTIKESLESYEGELPHIKEVKEDLVYYKNYKETQIVSEKAIRKIETSLKTKENLYSEKLVECRRFIEEKIEYLSDIEESSEEEEESSEYESDESSEYDEKDDSTVESCNIEEIQNMNEKDIRKAILSESKKEEKLTTYKDIIKTKIKEIDEIKINIKKVENKLFSKILKDEFSKDKIEEIIPTLEEIISSIERKITAYVKKREQHKGNIILIEKFYVYEKELEKYNSLVKKVRGFEKTEINCRNKLGGALSLKIKILEAESIAIKSIISSINSHAQIYLDIFFEEDPITVELLPYKEIKSKKIRKPQIDVRISHKGIDSHLSMLSGGELARVVLAFSLALGEMFNVPILMLDESTANLDQELTSVVMEGIKDNFRGKMCLVIAHQVVKGQFDRVVNVP